MSKKVTNKRKPVLKEPESQKFTVEIVLFEKHMQVKVLDVPDHPGNREAVANCLRTAASIVEGNTSSPPQKH